MKEEKGMIFDIKRFAIHDGPGIRTTVFLKGCPLECWWCANPEGQKEEKEAIISPFQLDDEDKCIKDIVGEEMNSQQVINEITKDRVFYEESSGGVTFSGGEPLIQSEFLYSLLVHSRNEGFHIALDTSGYAPQSIFEKIIDFVDLFLYDLKLFDEEEHKKYTGVSNDLILQNLSYLIAKKQQVIIRIPIIPEITDTSENLSQISKYLTEIRFNNRVDILPYNKMGEAKYTRLEKAYKLNNIVPPSEERMNEIKYKLEQFGLKVKIGG